MTYFYFFIIVLIFIKAIFRALKKNNNSPDMNDISLEAQLDTFKKLGFILNPNANIDDINRWGGEEKFIKEPYELLYFTLGQQTERDPWEPLTNRCWHFDAEAIEDHGSYVKIIENLGRISRGEMNFENIEDYVDIEEEKAWVSFDLNKDHYKYDLKISDDWVDPDLFSHIIELTTKYATSGKYTYYPGGQDCVIGFETPESLAEIRKATGLNILWLENHNI